VAKPRPIVSKNERRVDLRMMFPPQFFPVSVSRNFFSGSRFVCGQGAGKMVNDDQ
jgi:hypothetical protein